MMEHIELAGIHSGDSACVIPMRTASPIVAAAIRRATHDLARALGVVGLLNIQFAVKGERAMVLEVNPRASRTVPFVSKAIGRPLARYAVRAMLGETLKEIGFERERSTTHVCVKEAVLPFNKFPDSDVHLGPEMKSTGEVMGIAPEFGAAFWKAQTAAGNPLPKEGAVLLSVRDEDKEGLVPVALAFAEMGFELLATAGTHAHLAGRGIGTRVVHKRGEARPDLVDAMINGEVQLVVNTVVGRRSRLDEGVIRRTCLSHSIPIVSTIAAAQAAAEAIAHHRAGESARPVALQDYHESLTARYRR
jgi:carbamoyl-phosphate synthase large subunit